VGAAQREIATKSRALSLDLEKVQEPTRPGRKTAGQRIQFSADPPTKVLLVWLESFEDALTLPISALPFFKN